MNDEQKIIFERYISGKTIVEEDLNDKYAPEEAPEDDQLGQMEPLEDEDAEDNSGVEIAKSLEAIVKELKTLNQYVDFLTTGSRSPGFTSPNYQQDKKN